jgi:hypothetical protein
MVCPNVRLIEAETDRENNANGRGNWWGAAPELQICPREASQPH